MKNKKSQPAWRRFTFLALLVSLLACIATALLAITRALVTAGTFTVANLDTLTRWLYSSAGLIVLGIAVYFLLEPQRVRRFVSGRQARYGSNALVMSLAFIGVLVFGNLIAVQNPVPLGDLTEDQANTLSEQMLTALDTLPEEINATAYFTAQTNTSSAEELLEKIKNNSNGKFDYQFIDPNRDPQSALAQGIRADGNIALQMGERREIANFADETEILTAMIRLMNAEDHVVYFLTGHGERDIEQGSDEAMFRAKTTLETKNYTVKTLNLLAENSIPEDATVLVIAGPTKAVSSGEVALIKAFLENGSALIVMQEPAPLTEFGDANDPVAEYLSTEWGISLDNDIVIDLRTQNVSDAIGAFYDPSHPITRRMNNIATVYPFTRSVTNISEVESVIKTNLVTTAEQAWGETDFASLTQGGGQVGYDEAVDPLGPMTLVIAGENTTTSGRVVVFGSSTFATDLYFDTYGNGDIFANAVDWTAEEENLANLTPKTPIERSLLPPSSFQWIMIWLSAIFIIPGLIVTLGVVTWFTRRRQG